MTGDADPWEIIEKLEAKIKKKVELISPAGPKKEKGKDKDKEKEKEKEKEKDKDKGKEKGKDGGKDGKSKDVKGKDKGEKEKDKGEKEKPKEVISLTPHASFANIIRSCKFGTFLGTSDNVVTSCSQIPPYF